jgi:hypothetical protein
MSYELIKTLNGPLIKYGDAYVTAQEPHILIEIAESDASFIPAFKAHIIENLRLFVNEMCEAFEDGMSHMSPSINAYINASFTFNNFINGPWATYKKAKAEGGFQ